MKILRITFENIHSLYGQHTIDWDVAPLKGEGLFLITGPTGAGKSTLLDVMTIALYNKISRLPSLSVGVIESTGSVVTHGCDSAFAEVVYSCSQGIFRSRWSIQKNRKGTNFSDYKMELWRDSDNQKIESQNTRVQQMNVELIGLDFEQFTRAIMLAQGDFAQLLKAKKNDRGILLEKITGTSIYSLLGSKCFEIEATLRQEVLQLENALKSIRLLTPDELTVRKEQLEEYRRRQQLNQVHLTTVEKELSTARKLKETEDKWLLAQKEWQQAEFLDRKFQTEKLPVLQGYERLQPLLEPISQLRQRLDLLKQLNGQKLQAEEKASLLEKQKADWQKEVASFVMDFSLEKDQEVQLQNFRDRVLEQEQRVREAASQEVKDKERLKEFHARLEPDWKSIVSTGIMQAIEEFEKINKTLTAQQKSLQAVLQEELKDDPEKKHNELHARSVGLTRLQERIREYEKKLEDSKKLKSDTLANKEEGQTLLVEYEKAKTKSETLQVQLNQLRERLQKQTLSRSLEAHRKHLKEGDPCPLCGSNEHPYVKHYEDFVEDLGKDLKQLEADWKLSSGEETLLLKKQTTAQERLQNQLKEINELEEEKKRLAAEITSIKEEYQFNFSYSEDRAWPVREGERVQKLYDDLGLYLRTERQLKQLSDLLGLLKASKSAREHHSEQQNILSGLYQGETIGVRVDKLLKRWNTLLEQIVQNRHVGEELNRKIPSETNKLRVQEDTLQEQLKEAGFADLEEALQARIQEEEYQKLQREQQQLQVQLLSAHKRQEEFHKEFHALSKEGSSVPVEALEEKFLEYRTERDTLLKEGGAIERELQLDEETRSRMTQQIKELEEKSKLHVKWERLNKIIGDKEGKKFRNFAQQLTLQQLLYQANLHLKDLHNRYEFEMPDNDDKEELRIIDHHLADTRRSVSTLSGGETFLASLALALGLSDMAARNTKLECLFIDEGFGTLDPDSLEIAINTLENLRVKDNKTIGIISHLEQLKDRVPVKIQVIRNQEGFSKIVLTGGR